MINKFMKIQYIGNVLILFLVFYLSCSNKGYYSLENINNYLKKVSKGRYVIVNSLVCDRYYELLDEQYLEVPSLDFEGFFLFYPSNEEEYVSLDWQGRFEDGDKLPYHGIKEVFIYSKFILFKSINDCDYIKVYIEDFDIKLEKNIKILPAEKFKKAIYIFPNKIRNQPHNLIHYNYGIEDTTKPSYQPGSTPIIDGITKISICRINDSTFLFGETIYSFFILDVRSNKIEFLDRNKYAEFLSLALKNEHSDIISTYYEYFIDKKIKNKKNITENFFKVYTN